MVVSEFFIHFRFDSVSITLGRIHMTSGTNGESGWARLVVIEWTACLAAAYPTDFGFGSRAPADPVKMRRPVESRNL